MFHSVNIFSLSSQQPHINSIQVTKQFSEVRQEVIIQTLRLYCPLSIPSSEYSFSLCLCTKCLDQKYEQSLKYLTQTLFMLTTLASYLFLLSRRLKASQHKALLVHRQQHIHRHLTAVAVAHFPRKLGMFSFSSLRIIQISDCFLLRPCLRILSIFSPSQYVKCKRS